MAEWLWIVMRPNTAVHFEAKLNQKQKNSACNLQSLQDRSSILIRISLLTIGTELSEYDAEHRAEHD